MSNGLAKKHEVIDVDVKDVNNNPTHEEKEEPKMSWFEKHPVFCRRAKKILKIVGGMAAIGGSVYAGQKLADSKRTYYTLDLDGRADGTYHVSDVNPDLLDLSKEVVVTDKEETTE